MSKPIQELIKDFYSKFGEHEDYCPYYMSLSQVIDIIKTSNYDLSKIDTSEKACICGD